MKRQIQVRAIDLERPIGEKWRRYDQDFCVEKGIMEKAERK